MPNEKQQEYEDRLRNDLKRIGKRLRALRGCRTMSGVCRETGISYSMLTKIEYGMRKPGGEVLKKLAEYYGVSEKSILNPEDGA